MKKVLKKVMVMFLVLSLLFGVVACGKTPADEFEDIHKASVDKLVEAIELGYDSMERGGEAQAYKLSVSARIGSTVNMLLKTFTGMDFAWIKDVSVDIGGSFNDSVTVADLSLAYSGKALVSAIIAVDSLTGDVYAAVPALAEKYLKLDASELPEGTAAGLQSDELVTLLPEEKAVTDILERYFGIIFDNITEVAKTEGAITANGVVEECNVFEVTLSQKQFADILADIITAAKDDAQIKELVSSFVEIGNSYYPEDEKVSVDEVYGDFVENANEMLKLLEEANANGEITDETMVSLKTYVGARSAVLGNDITVSADGDTVHLFVGRAKAESTIGEELVVTVSHDDGTESFDVFSASIKGELDDVSGIISGKYTVALEGEDLLYVDVAGLNEKAMEKGEFIGNVTVSPAKALLDMLTEELGSDMAMMSSMLSTMSIKLVCEEAEPEKLTLSLMVGTEEYFALILNYSASNKAAAKLPDGADTETDPEAWAESLDFDKLSDAVAESGLPAQIVTLLEQLISSLEASLS